MQIEQRLLKHLVPIRQLHKEHQLQMAEQSHMVELRPGDELSANEEHRWFLYLIDGRLDMLDVNQQPVLLRHSDSRAHHPLFKDGEHKTRLVAHSHCQVARFDRQLFSTFQDQELITGEELETVEMNEVESNLFNVIMHAFSMGEMQLPSLPDVAIKVKKAVSSADVSADDVAKIVAADPALVTRLIRAANGPLNRGVAPIDSINLAVVRLGMQTCKDLVISFAVKELFETKSNILKHRMHQLYDHSIDVAAISFALSKQSGQLSPDHALLAGLLHQIGVIPILSYIETTGLVVSSDDELEMIIQRLRGAVGSMVIKHWELSTDLLDVVEEYENWQRSSPGRIDSCDLIIIAHIYSRLKHHQLEGLPKVNEVPAFKKLFPENQSADFAGKVFEQAHEEIASIMSLLKL